jgi:hypothetical protein
MRRLNLAVTIITLVSRPAQAATAYLERVESPVYSVEGDVSSITRRAATCSAQILKPGLVAAPTILNVDVVGGVVVANNAFDYSEKVFGSPLISPARTTVTIEAKTGRFRIVHTDIQVLNLGDWRPIRAAKEGKPDQMRNQLLLISDLVAHCVDGSGSSKW